MMQCNKFSVLTRAIGTVLLLVVLSACAKTTPPQRLGTREISRIESEQQTKMGWHAVRFKIHWADEQEPSWFFGALIAGEIVSPILKQYRSEIVLWRIHRRAVRDKTGHVFSFIFYSSQTDAVRLYQAFQTSEALASLQRQQSLEKVSYDALQINLPEKIAATSDPVWPEKMRNSWPFFMMGASQMWLEQVRSLKKESLDEPDLTRRYQDMQDRMTELWQEQGKHALMHHLSGLYAYQPVLVRF